MKSIFLILALVASLFTQYGYASEKCTKKCTPDPVTNITNNSSQYYYADQAVVTHVFDKK